MALNKPVYGSCNIAKEEEYIKAKLCLLSAIHSSLNLDYQLALANQGRVEKWGFKLLSANHILLTAPIVTHLTKKSS